MFTSTDELTQEVLKRVSFLDFTSISYDTFQLALFTNRKLVYDFLLVINYNLSSLSPHFRDIAPQKRSRKLLTNKFI